MSQPLFHEWEQHDMELSKPMQGHGPWFDACRGPLRKRKWGSCQDTTTDWVPQLHDPHGEDRPVQGEHWRFYTAEHVGNSTGSLMLRRSRVSSDGDSKLMVKTHFQLESTMTQISSDAGSLIPSGIFLFALGLPIHGDDCPEFRT